MTLASPFAGLSNRARREDRFQVYFDACVEATSTTEESEAYAALKKALPERRDMMAAMLWALERQDPSVQLGVIE